MRRQSPDWERRLRHEMVAILPRLRRFAAGLCGSGEEGDDLVQAACEKALSCLDQFQPGTRLDSWMYRIIQTQWLDRLRRERAQASEVRKAVAETSGSLEAALEARSTLERVRREISRLPDEQRAVLLLVCGEGLSYKDAAETLNIPIGTVMSRLARARANLVRLVEEPGPAQSEKIVTLSERTHGRNR